MIVSAYSLASRYLDVHELPGGENHPFIQWCLVQAGFSYHVADEVPWCAAFVNHFAWLLNLPRPAFPARARHWLMAGEDITLPEATSAFDIVVLSREEGDPGPDTIDAPGHVGFFSRYEVAEDHLWLLGGNQHDRVSISPYPLSRVLGIRRLV